MDHHSDATLDELAGLFLTPQQPQQPHTPPADPLGGPAQGLSLIHI